MTNRCRGQLLRKTYKFDFGRASSDFQVVPPRGRADMLPEGWRTFLLGDVTTFKNGLNFTAADDGEAIKIVGVSDFKRHTQLLNTDGLATIRVAKRVRDEELLTSGDLLFVRSNGNKALVGRCLFLPSVMERLAFSGFTIRGRVDPAVLLPSFASHLMRSDAVREQMLSAGDGTSICNLSQESLGNISIQIPSLVEQERIARMLDACDRENSVSEQLLVNSRQQKKVLMEDLISGARRVPDHSCQKQSEDDDGPAGKAPRNGS
jgi:type I restriction enzyme S subunit